jgi:hypothetical protein
MTPRKDPMRTHRLVSAAALAIGLLGLPAGAAAQVNSTEATASLSATLSESLTVSLLPGSTSFTLTGNSATNAGSATIAATTTWTLSAARTGLALYAYFTTAATALVHTDTNNSVDIPSSRVEVSVNGGALAALNQSVAFGGAAAGRQLFSLAITPANASGSRVDTLALNINLNGLVLPADSYNGTLRVRAQATP